MQIVIQILRLISSHFLNMMTTVVETMKGPISLQHELKRK